MPAPAACAETPVKDAATVAVVRDGPRGLEVLMLRRNAASAFVPRAYLFPGGAVDPADGDPVLVARCVGWTDDAASAAIGVAGGGLAWWVAAVRECFEEAGLLLAHRGDGRRIDLDRPVRAARFAAHRDALNAATVTFAEICEGERLQLDVGTLHPFAHFITPPGAVRRYDTQFFVTHAPTAQAALHDRREAVANRWICPAEALERNARGGFVLIEPTRASLEVLARFAAVEDLLGAARSAGRDPDQLAAAARREEGVRITPTSRADGRG